MEKLLTERQVAEILGRSLGTRPKRLGRASSALSVATSSSSSWMRVEAVVPSVVMPLNVQRHTALARSLRE